MIYIVGLKKNLVPSKFPLLVSPHLHRVLTAIKLVTHCLISD